MSENFEELAEAVRRKVYFKYSTSHLVDDLAQEAVFQAWRLHMDGKEDGYILFWAPKQVVKFLGTKPEPFTGSTKDHGGGSRQTTTTTEGDVNRQKIKQAQQTYMDLHGTKPSNAEIGRMIGMEPRRVSKYVNRANFHLTTDLPDSPVVTHLDAWSAEYSGGDLSYNHAVAVEGFEDVSVDRLLVEDLLPDLKEREREVVYLHYWQDMPQADVARALKISPAYTHRVHKEAISHLRVLLEVE
jgi:DNA-directed RNA polymerase specialized sigma24 family protein